MPRPPLPIIIPSDALRILSKFLIPSWLSILANILISSPLIPRISLT